MGVQFTSMFINDIMFNMSLFSIPRCGEDGSDMNWFGDEVSQNPDNLKGMEDCVEYHNANESLGFAGNDITCDVENFIICDVAPRVF